MASIYLETPFCGVKVTEQGDSIREVDFFSKSRSKSPVQSTLLNKARQQISQYLQSAQFKFDLPLEPQGTDYQRRVWAALQQIPAGEVRTYGEIARQLGSSARAVGNACRKNPIPLIIPCHRVVSAQGIGGFAGKTQGQKISLKQQLLAHEGVEIPA